MHVIIIHNRYSYNAELAISCLRGSVGSTREYCTLKFLSSALLVRIPCATFTLKILKKTIVFIFIKFSPFAISFFYFNSFDLYGDNTILSSDL